MDYTMKMPSKFAGLASFKKLIRHLEKNYPEHADLPYMRHGYEVARLTDISCFNGDFSPFEATTEPEFDAKISMRFAWCQAQMLDASLSIREKAEISTAKDMCEYVLREFQEQKIILTGHNPIRVHLKAGYIETI